jgi:phage shock protein C
MSSISEGTKVLVRSRNSGMVAGVCAGVAEYFGWDVTVVRMVVAVVSIITGGTGALAYLVAWAVIPKEGDTSSLAEDLTSKSQRPAGGSVGGPGHAGG